MSGQRAGRFLWGLTAAVVWLSAGFLRPTAAAEEELRIGFLAPMTGIFAQIGREMRNGFEMYLEEAGRRFGRLQVRFIVEDGQGKPAVNVQKAEKLIRQDRVHLLVGGLLASTGYALAPVSTRRKTVYIASTPAADDLTQRRKKLFPYLIRTGWGASSQPSHPLGDWACKQGYKRIVAIGADYALGHEAIGGFQKAFEDCGGKIIQKIWPPLGTKDFGPYLPQIKKADALFTLMAGPMSIQFPKQYRAAGLKMPLLGSGVSADEFALPFMGDEAVGYVTAEQYSAALQIPKNEAFVKAYRAKYGRITSYYSETNYTTAQWIHKVIERAGGRWPGQDRFVRLFASTPLDSVRGPLRLDEMMNPIQNVYIRKVERKKMFGYEKEELWNTVIKTYENVGQFWKYGKEEFLKQPVYNRDFPPCRYCE